MFIHNRHELLRYCKLHPDDDEARLVFADWLEENGESQRAEFVRLQLLTAYLSSDWYSGQDERRACELRLLKRNVRRWTHGSLQDSYHWIGFRSDIAGNGEAKDSGPTGRFERGTLSLHCSLSDLVEFFDRLPSHVTSYLEKITISGLNDDTLLQAVLAAPEMAEFTSFSLRWQQEEPTPDLEWLDQGHVRKLAIGDPTGTGEVWTRLASASNLRLSKLSASPSRQNYGGWPGFLSSSVVERVTFLSTSIPDDSEPLAHLRNANLPNLNQLDLYFYGRHYSASDVQDLLDAPNLATLTNLKLLGFRGDLRGMIAPLAFSKSLGQLRKIDLGFNVVSEQDAAALARSPVLAQVKDLRFHSSRFTPEAAAALAASPYLASLESLDLSCAGIGDLGLSAFAASPHLRKLRRLHVCRSNISGVGLKALASSPYLTNLQDLDLALNPLSADALIALAKSDPLTNIQSLRIGAHGLSSSAVTELLQSPLVQRLERLDIKGISSDHVRVLTRSRLENLRRLTIGETALKPGDVDLLMEAPWLSGVIHLCLDVPLQDSGIRKMTTNLRPGSLAMLWVKTNSLTDAAAAALLAWPSLPNLVDFPLDETLISKERQEEINKVVISDYRPVMTE
jgi:uncharacterized protein (TIGR02996 family)